MVAALLGPPVLVSSLAAAVLASVAGCATYGCNAGTLGFGAWIGAIYGVSFGVPAALLLGWPAHHLLVLTRKTNAAFYAFAGALLGLPTTVAVLAVTASYSFGMPSEALLTILSIGASVGATSAFVFWLIRRPDRDQAPSSKDTSA